MIPKKIHYCWFGGNSLSSEVRECIASWRRFCPDYEIIEWNEKNFDVDCIRYTADAYRDRRWAYVTDYARLKIVYEQGGIYLDTDVELLRPLDPLLENKVYFGMQRAGEVATGLGFGAGGGAGPLGGRGEGEGGARQRPGGGGGGRQGACADLRCDRRRGVFCARTAGGGYCSAARRGHGLSCRIF